jgi:predicted nucleic acid-binding protein
LVNYLLDTNVVSELRKPHADANVKEWFATTRGDELYMSVLTVGEIRRGIERLRRRDPTQAAMIETWLATLRRDHAQRLLRVTDEIAEEWGRLGVRDPIPTIDGLLAATARVGDLTLVTRNSADLMHTGARLLDPFEPHHVYGSRNSLRRLGTRS